MKKESVFITGDVHDCQMGGLDQVWLKKHHKKTEVQCALKFCRIADRCGLPLTLFMTGLSVQREPLEVKNIFETGNAEIGGHTWNALRPEWKHILWKKLSGSYYGPKIFQSMDIKMTLDTIEQKTGLRPISWRTHGYRGDETTFSLLQHYNVKVVSDIIGPDYSCEYIKNNLLSLPINTPPDHEHLFHGYFTEKRMTDERLLRASPLNIFNVKKSRSNCLRFNKELLKRALKIKTPKKAFGEIILNKYRWKQWLHSEVSSRLEKQGFAVLLLHPADMEVLDSMETLEEIFSELTSYNCSFVRDSYNLFK